MAHSYLCSLPLLLLIAGLCDASDYSILNFAMAKRHEMWMAEYGKVYRDEGEKAKRFEIFKKNVNYIEDFNNAGDHSYTLGINEFADLTDEEAMARFTGRFKMPWPQRKFGRDEGSHREPLNLSAVPESVDWRAKGAVTRVKHQGGCASCWAFVAVAALESLVKIKKDVLYDLSEQQLVDCDTGNKHCGPGYVDEAFKYINKNKGLTTSANYPYTAVQSPCNAKKENETVTDTAIRSFKYVSNEREDILKAAVAEQPVGVSFKAAADFQQYEKGIFNGSCEKYINHALTLVGYGTEGSTKYWIAKNSYGDKWGESGYIRLAREVSSPQGVCGLAVYPTYPYM